MKSKIQFEFLNTVVLIRDFQGNVIAVSRKVPDSFFQMNLLAEDICYDSIDLSYWQKNVSIIRINDQEMYQEEYVNITKLLMENKKLSHKLRKDPLTEISNVVALKEKEKEILSFNKNCVIVICDVDCFKEINDTYGHQFGDKVLVSLAKIFNKNKRGKQDLIARSGGDEFTFYFETKDVSCIIDKMYKIQKEVRQLGCELGLDLSISIGVSYFNSELCTGDEAKAILKRNKKEADDALYFIKNNVKGEDNVAYFNTSTNMVELYHLKDKKVKMITKELK